MTGRPPLIDAATAGLGWSIAWMFGALAVGLILGRRVEE